MTKTRLDLITRQRRVAILSISPAQNVFKINNRYYFIETLFSYTRAQVKFRFTRNKILGVHQNEIFFFLYPVARIL